MDARLLDLLRNAPSLELYELSQAIELMLTDPRRILEVRRHLHLGAHVMYFNNRRGALAPGRIIQLQTASATVQDDATRAHWKLPYAAIVADPAHRTASPQPAPPVEMPSFNVGDTVGFTDKHLRERVGTITRVNTKTYSVLSEGEQWRVPPRLLRKIIDL